MFFGTLMKVWFATNVRIEKVAEIVECCRTGRCFTSGGFEVYQKTVRPKWHPLSTDPIRHPVILGLFVRVLSGDVTRLERPDVRGRGCRTNDPGGFDGLLFHLAESVDATGWWCTRRSRPCATSEASEGGGKWELFPKAWNSTQTDLVEMIRIRCMRFGICLPAVSRTRGSSIGRSAIWINLRPSPPSGEFLVWQCYKGLEIEGFT